MGTAPPKEGLAPPEDGAVRASGTGRILSNAFYRAVADVGSKVVSLAFFLVVARELGSAAFGVFTFGLSFASLVTVFAGLGQDAILTREVAKDRRLVDRYFSNTLALKVVAAVPVVVVSIAAMTIAGVDSRTRTVTILLSIAVLVELLTTTTFAVLQAYERLGFLPLVIVFQRLVTAGAGIAAMLSGADIEAVAAIYLVGAVLAFGLALGLQFRYVVRPRLALDASSWWPLMRVAIPVGVALIFQLSLFRADIVILQFLDTERVVGQYGAAYRLFEATLFVSWAIGAAIYPVISRYENETDVVRRVFERAVKLAVAVTLPAALVGGILAQPIVHLLYGAEFEPSARALQLLAPAIVLCSVSHVTAVLLLAEHRERTIAVVYAIVAAANITANFALIPRYSLNAAAAITSLSELLLCLLMLGYLSRHRIALDWRRVLTGSVAAGVPAAAVLLLLRDYPLAAGILAIAVFGGVLALAEQMLYPEDARRIWRVARRLQYSLPGSHG